MTSSDEKYASKWVKHTIFACVNTDAIKLTAQKEAERKMKTKENCRHTCSWEAHEKKMYF